ncbi:hypothetical protein G7K_6309-t1 [Saitoella complicata NRRL Y-17804]|uniref:Uncharacterized protein n=1 Tax=Saitoella complicata (strain BCRC 22490 / CBS 7301 / JCM 7358 / NBRC 10748 / NRRL Y-17804) TaxID=698492 RepID=A0A0E9NQS0_SAICN|nr:hypothetical protein G7K_6309-t1 [Saitoella complicata NRRL Y-17804]
MGYGESACFSSVVFGQRSWHLRRPCKWMIYVPSVVIERLLRLVDRYPRLLRLRAGGERSAGVTLEGVMLQHWICTLHTRTQQMPRGPRFLLYEDSQYNSNHTI